MDFARALRSLRLRCGYSPERLAGQIGIAATTVYRWEDGSEYPSLDLVEAALRAYRCSQSERIQALCLLPRRRGIEALREEARERALPELAEWMPIAGSLLEAMRLRAGRTADEIAVKLGVSPSTFSRWENGRVVVPEDRLAALCEALDAAEWEKRALVSGAVLLGVDGGRSVSEQRCEQALGWIASHRADLTCAPADLLFLKLEAQLWRLSLSNESCLHLLKAAYVEHADYLLWRGREREMGEYARRAITLAERLNCVDATLMRAVLLNGKAETDSNVRRTWRRGLEFLARWEDVAHRTGCLPTLYRDMAGYALDAGSYSQVGALVARSRAAIGGADAAADARLADMIQARFHKRVGDPHSAAKYLHDDDDMPCGLRIFELLLAAGVFIDLGSSSDASERLTRVVQLIEERGFQHLRVHADRLYRLL